MSSENASKQATRLDRLTVTSKGRVFGGLASILLSFVHLFLELLGLFLVHERQPSQALLELEGVEKGAVLVILPCVEDLLVPYHSLVCGLHTACQ